MARLIAVALILNLSFTSIAAARQSAQGPIRASLEREALRLASGPVVQSAGKPAARPQLDERVRITFSAPDSPTQVIGTIVRVDDQTISYVRESGGRPVTVPRSSVAMIERSNGERSRGRATTIGAVVGVAGGLALGGLMNPSPRCSQVYDSCGGEEVRAHYQLFFSSLLGVLGGLSGARSVRPEEWIPVPLSSLSNR
jgi:hypothetical protein